MELVTSTSSGVANAVWTATTRSLTNMGAALAANSTAQTSLAANTGVDLRLAAGKVGLITIAAITGATATGAVTLQDFDGTNGRAVATSAASSSAPVAFHLVNTNTVGGRIFNGDASVAALYVVSGLTFTL